MEENQKNSAIWYTVGIIVIIIAAYLMFFRGPASTDEVTTTDMASTTDAVATSTAGASASVEISDQVASSTVTVDRIVANAPVWVAIHEDLNGKPSNILGAAWVPAGESLNIAVELQRNVVAGGKYYAMIHAEDGSGAADFDFKKDLPLTDIAGAAIMKTFTVLVEKN